MATGHTFEGQFNDDIVHGQGRLTKNGAIFVGVFNRDKREGLGYERDTEGNIFIGNFEDG